MPMRRRMMIRLSCIAVLLAPASAHSQSLSPSPREVMIRLRAEPNALARYNYLTAVIPSLDKNDQPFAQQLLATVDSELGLYNEAMIAFPFDNRITPPKSIPLPYSHKWQSIDAADAIVELAAQRQIVMINEAHHDAHTRALTLALLPRLRALGFHYFAAEALSDKDVDLMHRGYPTDASGSEYLLEPLYGEIVRQAIKLGYIIVPYDPTTVSINDRDTEQARELYEKVFAKDPQAKLFVHAGYSHIDKAIGNLGGDIRPMAMQLKQLTGDDPLCVDQVQFRDVAIGGLDYGFYANLALRFPSTGPIAIRERNSGIVWSSDPRQHDISVILPPVLESDLDTNAVSKADGIRPPTLLLRHAFDLDERPAWLTLGGKRIAYRINANLCMEQTPCAIDAYYPGEPDTAIPADRYTFLHANSHNVLYLYPGHYRLRAWNTTGTTLSQLEIDVASQ